MQAEGHKNHPIPHTHAKTQTTERVEIFLGCYPTGSDLNFSPKLIGVKKKLERREATRERKALSAAHLERSIEKELIERLKSKAYGDAPLNVNEEVWAAVLRKEKGEIEGVDLEDEESEEEEEAELEREFVSDDSGLEDEDGFDGLSDLEEMEEAEVRTPSSLH
jgi:protein MAK16